MTGRRHVGDASATRRPRGQLSEHRRQRCRRLLAGSFSGEDCHSPNEFNMRALKLSQYCYCTEREAALTGAPFPRSGDLFPCSSSASPVLGRRRWPEEDRPAPPGLSLSRPRSPRVEPSRTALDRQDCRVTSLLSLSPNTRHSPHWPQLHTLIN